jgi:PPOX class probable F420-dependent enzyme
MPVDEAFTALGDQQFVSLTTFRTSGEPVSTPVWVGRDGNSLVVTTSEKTGKVKRLRNNQRVEVQPCDRRGRVKEGTHSFAGVARVLSDHDEEQKRLTDVIARKYTFQYWVVIGIERLTRAGRRSRVIISITAS